MVAYQGDVRFENKGAGGLDKMIKSADHRRGRRHDECTGQGELFVADGAAEVQVMYLENDMISVNGNNILAFSSSIDWDIQRIKARGAAMTGGLYNVSLRGTGYVAVTTKGDPVALDVSGAPTFADAQAVVLWTAGVSMDIRVDTGGLKSMVRGGTGELLPDGVRRPGLRAGPAERVGHGGRPPAGGQQEQRRQRSGRAARRLIVSLPAPPGS